MHRQRLFKHIPKALLRVGEKQISVEWQHTLGEALGYTHLKFHVAVGATYLLSQWYAGRKIIVAIEREIGAVVEGIAYAVGILLVVTHTVVEIELSVRGRDGGCYCYK